MGNPSPISARRLDVVSSAHRLVFRVIAVVTAAVWLLHSEFSYRPPSWRVLSAGYVRA